MPKAAPPQFSDWLDTPQGQYVIAWEQERLDSMLADIFGFNAVQVGLPHTPLLRSNRMPFRALCHDVIDAGVSVCGQAVALPFAANSVDLLLMPHVLEFSQQPHQVLREAVRVLTPEGSLVVAGFNPYSLWGLRRRLQPTRTPPWQGRYLSIARLKDWFALLGLEPGAGYFGCYAPALQSAQGFARAHFLETMGARWWPVAGSVYLIQAIKRVSGMVRIQPGWKERMARARALIAMPSPAPAPHKSPRVAEMPGKMHIHRVCKG